MVEKRSLGMEPNTALSIDRDFDQEENVNILSSTLVMLYRARATVFSVAL